MTDGVVNHCHRVILTKSNTGGPKPDQTERDGLSFSAFLDGSLSRVYTALAPRNNLISCGLKPPSLSLNGFLLILAKLQARVYNTLIIQVSNKIALTSIKSRA